MTKECGSKKGFRDGAVGDIVAVEWFEQSAAIVDDAVNLSFISCNIYQYSH